MKRYPLTNQHIAVIGMGMTGLACARYLHEHQAQVAIYDTREAPAGLAEAQQLGTCHLGDINSDDMAAMILRADVVVVSPGIDLDQPVFAQVKAQGKALISEIELFADAVDRNKPIFAVTGSNGKSTVVSLHETMLNAAGKKVAMGGNFGIPALELLAQEADCYVLELSSFQLETTYHLAPAVACILNISEDHIDRHQSMENYIAAKQRIYDDAKMCVVNLDDAATWPAMDVAAKNSSSAEVRGFALTQSANADTQPTCHAYLRDCDDGSTDVVVDGQTLINSQSLVVQGRHNLQNIMACALMLADFITFDANVCEAISQFGGLDYRCQVVATVNSVTWVNDSKGTNVGATAAAISGLAGDDNVIVIAGGVGKGADFSPLADIAGVKQWLLFGRDAELMAQAIGQPERTLDFTTLDEAVNAANQMAVDGDIVLFSPACASFDQYANYVARGAHFNELVAALESVEAAS